MLALQRQYGCYRRSARMQAASYLSEQGLSSDFMPSRAAMDLLNDSLDDEMPEDGWRMLARFVAVEVEGGILLLQSEDGEEGRRGRGRGREWGRSQRRGMWPRLAKRLSWAR
jgi:hypothetical protein